MGAIYSDGDYYEHYRDFAEATKGDSKDDE